MKGMVFIMKRQWTAIISIFIIILSPLIGTTQAMATTKEDTTKEDWPSGPSVYAESAIVMEASTGLVLYEKNINDEHYPASITKIMTVLLALENSSLGDVVTFSENAVYDVDADSSRLWINVGEQLTMRQCLYAILLESANDVAYAVAEHVAGSVDNFANLMNEKAKSLGCKNTHFVNPHGLPEDNHYTTAYDMALITREAMKNEAFRKIFDTRSYQIPPTNLQTETRYLHNHHDFVKSDGYLYDDCIGGKTGYTNIARFTLVSAAKRGDLELICVIMKDDSNEHQYTDTQKLFDYAFDNFSIYPIADLEDSATLSESPLFTRYNSLLSQSDTPIITDKNGYLVLPNTASFEDALKEVSFFSSDTSTSADSGSDGKVIGKISYTYDGKYVGGADILYHSTETPALIQTESNTKNNPTATPNSNSTTASKSSRSLRPLIIGSIVGLIIIVIGLYYNFVERPRLKRRHAYYKKRALRKSYKDDFFNL
ncbi:MAG: D-alanyl-D-alanine carboxypeptidase [Herbinix sp.]|nr:D-alanyl-D-alanine carboxypeptidase [Herbinix sp.]